MKQLVSVFSTLPLLLEEAEGAPVGGEELRLLKGGVSVKLLPLVEDAAVRMVVKNIKVVWYMVFVFLLFLCREDYCVLCFCLIDP